MLTYDHLIVGGGSAGCVLAGRLSVDAGRHVLLLEAGRDTPPDRVPAAILDSDPRRACADPANLWPDLRVHVQPPGARGSQAEGVGYEQARIMGGGSAIDGMQATRGLPEDYNEWRRLGCRGWGWDDVLPHFVALERDMDFDGPLHGDRGPLPVRRVFPEVWPGFSRAAADAFRGAGYGELQDHNAEFGDGFFPLALTNLYDRRVSTAMAWLDNAARRRPNLEVRAQSRVTRLLLEGRRTVGVEVETQDGRETLRAHEVIVCAGALHTPALLMRAGVGPGDALRAHGIEVLVDRPGVGANLMDHPAVALVAHLRPEARLNDGLRLQSHVALRYSSGYEDSPPSDMHVGVVCRAGRGALGEYLGSLVAVVNKPFSRGRVRLADDGESPAASFDLAADERDVERLALGLRLLARLFRHPALQAVASDPFPVGAESRGALPEDGLARRRDALLPGLLAGPAWLRRGVMEHVVTGEPAPDALLADEAALREDLRRRVQGMRHAAGTCRMGPGDDPQSVTDEQGRVHGMAGLRVVDASLMPSLPRARTNLPVVMMAEKIAAAMRRDTAGAVRMV